MTQSTIVLGLGGMGSATVYELARRGTRAIGLERHGPAHAQGSSHGKSRIIRQAYFEDPAYVPLLLRAYERWRDFERECGAELLTITGGLMIGAPGSEVLQGSIRSAREYGLAHEVLESDAIRRRFPPLQTAPHELGLYEAMAGFVRPEASVAAYLARAEAHGAELHFGETALSWEPRAGGVRVTTDRARYEADRLIVTAGPWLPELLGDLRLPLRVERQVLYWFAPRGGVAPFLPDRFPIYIWEPRPGYAFYGFPHQEGAPGGVKIAFHTGGTPTDPHRIDREVHDAEIAAMREAFAERIPLLDGELLATATCMYTLTPDEHFAFGLHPQHPQVVIASPCSGHGFKFVSAMGEVLADLGLTGATRHPIAPFALTRFA